MMFPKPQKRKSARTMTAKEFRKALEEKAHKYSAAWVKPQDGSKAFPSKLEHAVWQLLKWRERAGEIRNVIRYPQVRLKDKCSHCGASAVDYTVDFRFELDTGQYVYVEAKGCEDRTYKRNKKLWQQVGPAPLQVWKGRWEKPFLAEVVLPKTQREKTP